MKWIVKRYFVEIYQVEAETKQEAIDKVLEPNPPSYDHKELKTTAKKAKEKR